MSVINVGDPKVFTFTGDTIGNQTITLTSDGEENRLSVASGEVAILTPRVFARVYEYSGMGSPTVGDVLYSNNTYYFYNTGSGVLQVGGIAYPGNSGTFNGTWSIVRSGDDITFSVTGRANENVNWIIRAEFSKG